MRYNQFGVGRRSRRTGYHFNSLLASIFSLYSVGPEESLSRVGKARAVLGAGTTSDQARRILSALPNGSASE